MLYLEQSSHFSWIKPAVSQEHLIKSWGWEEDDLDIQRARGWHTGSLITGLSVITRGFACNPGSCSRLSIIRLKYVRSATGGGKATCSSRVLTGFCETVCCCRPRVLPNGDYLSVHVVSAALSLALMLGSNTLHNNPTAWPQRCGTTQKFHKYIEIKSNAISSDISTIIWKHWLCCGQTVSSHPDLIRNRFCPVQQTATCCWETQRILFIHKQIIYAHVDSKSGWVASAWNWSSFLRACDRTLVRGLI